MLFHYFIASYEECEAYEETTAAEDDDDDEELQRARRNRTKLRDPNCVYDSDQGK